MFMPGSTSVTSQEPQLGGEPPQPSYGCENLQEAYDWHNEATFNETWSMLQKCEAGLLASLLLRLWAVGGSPVLPSTASQNELCAGFGARLVRM